MQKFLLFIIPALSIGIAIGALAIGTTNSNDNAGDSTDMLADASNSDEQALRDLSSENAELKRRLDDYEVSLNAIEARMREMQERLDSAPDAAAIRNIDVPLTDGSDEPLVDVDEPIKPDVTISPEAQKKPKGYDKDHKHKLKPGDNYFNLSKEYYGTMSHWRIIETSNEGDWDGVTNKKDQVVLIPALKSSLDSAAETRKQEELARELERIAIDASQNRNARVQAMDRLSKMGNFADWNLIGNIRYDPNAWIAQSARYYTMNYQRPVTGYLVRQVHRRTQAQRLGIQRGDIIVEYNGQAITKEMSITKAKETLLPGQASSMVIYRDGVLSSYTINEGRIGIAGGTITKRDP